MTESQDVRETPSSNELFTLGTMPEGARGNQASARSACSGPGLVALSPARGIRPRAKSTPFSMVKCAGFWPKIGKANKPVLGIYAGGVNHAKSCSVEDFQNWERLPDRQRAHEKTDKNLERTSEMVAARGRFSLFADFLDFQGMWGAV